MSIFEDHDGPPSCDEIQIQGVIGDTWERLCECDWSEVGNRTPLRRADAMANARLIAAAPDLLEALQAIVRRLSLCAEHGTTAYEAFDSFYQNLAQDAIVKATGEQP